MEQCTRGRVGHAVLLRHVKTNSCPPCRAVPHTAPPTASQRTRCGAAPPPAHVAELAVAAAKPRPAAGLEERVHIHVRQVPAGEGTRATRERCERCARGGNRRGQ